MPRLLIATTVGSTVQAFLLPFARHYREKGWQVDALASGLSSCEECVSTFDRVWDIQWSRNPANLSGALSGLRRVREIVTDGDYDVVHVHTPVAAFIVRAALRKRGPRPKVVYTAHGFHFHPSGSVWKNRIFIALEKLAGKWTDALVTINDEDYEAAKRLQIVPLDRLSFMPGIGIDVNHYSKEAISDRQLSQLRQDLNLKDSGCIFLQVAEFIPRKRHCDLLRAFSQLKCPAALLLAGPGPLQTDMQKLAERLGIASRVRFLGLRKDIAALIRLANVVVLPSQQEGLPRSVMEAMAMGKPVIGSDIRGVRDLLKDGRGVLFPVGNVGALTAAMTSLAEDPKACRDFGSAGLKAIQNYDIKLILSHHDELYQGLLICPTTLE
ncbi:MAG TPA: glycosyltransferase family 4 protein [Terracidiphilus sp.]|nr:glycosyltransferase family 4 protein [Terracidiphilus sp.]